MNTSRPEVYSHSAISLDEALQRLDEVASQLFAFDQRIQSVGITRFDDGYGFRATRNKRIVLPQGSAGLASDVSAPVIYVDVFDIVRPLKIPPGGPSASPAPILERNVHRPLVCGLQIQNLDFDTRAGNGISTIGSLGCFIRGNGKVGILSNNHVLAGENGGQQGDRIVQPGAIASSDPHIGELHDFVELRYSSPRATPASGNVVWNEVDAAIAFLADGVDCHQRYLPHHGLPSITGVASPRIDEEVYKVGRGSAATRGSVVATNTVVPCKYYEGPCWFRNSIEIEGHGGLPFSAVGDSGAVVVNSSGEVIGVLYSGDNGTTSYACPISPALQALDCTIYSASIP